MANMASTTAAHGEGTTTSADAAVPPVANGLSARQLITSYPRERLYVHPLLWTTRHLQLLGCEFICGGTITIAPTIPETSPSPPDNAPPGNTPPSGSRPENSPAYDGNTMDLQHLHTNVAWARYFAYHGNDLSQLLEGLKPSRDHVRFRFDGRPVASLPCYVFSYAPQSPSQPKTPTQLCHLNLWEVKGLRKVKVCGHNPPPGFMRRENPPIRRYKRKNLQRVKPREPLEDPYIVAVLIALAQEEQHLREKETRNGGNKINNSTPCAHSLQVLLANNCKEFLHIYTSKISPKFLNRFNPGSHPCTMSVKEAQSRPGMAIRRRMLPFKPYETFAQRLKAVLQDVELLSGDDLEIKGERIRQNAVNAMLQAIV